MIAEPATKNDLQRLEDKLGARIDTVEHKLDGVARQVAVNTEQIAGLTKRVDGLTKRVDGLTKRVGGLTKRVDGLTEQVAGLTEQVAAFRVDLATLREDMNRDIARHMQAGFESMREMFGVLEDLNRDGQAWHDVLRRDFTDHTRDFVLHNERS